jgi:hypothetical protein
MTDNDESDRFDDFEVDLSITGDKFLARIEAAGDLMQLARIAKEPINLGPEIKVLSVEQLRGFASALRDTAGLLTQASQELKDRKAGDSLKKVELSLRTTDPTVGRALAKTLFRTTHMVRQPDRGLLIRRSLLSLVVSDFEVLVGKVALISLLEKPGLLDDGASISLRELADLKDVSDARRLVAERRVDELLRGTLDDWASWFNRLNVKWRDMTDNWTSFSEIFARRNVFVHADGRVTRQYTQAVDKSYFAGEAVPALGDQLPLSDEYLKSSTERLLAFGFLLLSGTWLQLRPKATDVAQEWIISRLEHLLDLGHFRAVRIISETVLSNSRGRLRQSIEHSIRIALWITMRELGDDEEVRRQIGVWDVSAVDLRLGHAKAVLLGDDNGAVAQIAELRKRGLLTDFDLIGSPLYRPLLERVGPERLLDTPSLAETLTAAERADVGPDLSDKNLTSDTEGVT